MHLTISSSNGHNSAMKLRREKEKVGNVSNSILRMKMYLT